MKTIFTAANGAITLTENAGVFTLSFDESLGGGAAAGVIKGAGSIIFNAASGSASAISLGEALLNAHLPASLAPLATVVEGIVNQALTKLE